MFNQTKFSNDDNPCIKTVAYSDHDPLTTLRAAIDIKIRPAYEQNLTIYEMLGSLGCNMYLCYSQTERVMGISSRDVYQINLVNALADGSIMLVSTEHPDKDNYPPREECVRMKLPLGGMWIKPDPDRPGKSIIHQYIEINPMTVLPDYLLKNFISKTAYGLVTLRSLIPDYVDRR